MSENQIDTLLKHIYWALRESEPNFTYLEKCGNELQVKSLSNFELEKILKNLPQDISTSFLPGTLLFDFFIAQPMITPTQALSLSIVKEAQISKFISLMSGPTYTRIVRTLFNFGYKTNVPVSFYKNAKLSKIEQEKIVRLDLVTKIGQSSNAEIALETVELVLYPEITVVPTGPIYGTIKIPGSKSISNRALLLAALGVGETKMYGLLDSDDIQVMLIALTHFGADFKWSEEKKELVLTVTGTGGNFSKVPRIPNGIFLNNSGTSSRFLTSTATLIGTQDNSPLVLTGNERMMERPIAPLVNALRCNGAEIKYLRKEGCFPISVKNSGLRGGDLEIEGKISSQFVSSVLLSAPYAQTPLSLKLLEKNPTSLPYILMTVELMREFGGSVEYDREKNIYHVGKGVYKNPNVFKIEPDASSSTYLLAAAAITGGEITVANIGSKSLQGDSKFHELLAAMGSSVSQSLSKTTVSGPRLLQSICVNMENLTDSFMTICALGAVANGRTEIVGIANQRVKECNRIKVMVEELSKCGIECGELEDGIWLIGNPSLRKIEKKVYIDCHDDHRIAMSFGVLSLRVEGIVIMDKECVSKTFPTFWDLLHNLTVEMDSAHEECVGNKISEKENSVEHLLTTRESIDFQNPNNLDSMAFDSPHHKISSANPYIFIVGMRGSGKSTLGSLASAALNLGFINMDDVLETEFGMTIKEFVLNNSWESFREMEQIFLRRLFEKRAQRRNVIIVSCGGGIVESENCQKLLTTYPYVIELKKDIENVIKDLKTDEDRAVLSESLEDTWVRRNPLFEKVSKWKFEVGENWSEATEEFLKLIRTILLEIESHKDQNFS